MEQPKNFSNCNQIKHISNELGHAYNRIHDAYQNLGERLQALLDGWVMIPVKHPKRLEASIP